MLARVHHNFSDYGYILATMSLLYATLGFFIYPARSVLTPGLIESVLKDLVRWCVVLFALTFVLFALKEGQSYSRYWVGATVILGFTFSILTILVRRGILGVSQGYTRNVVIIGTGKLSTTVYNRLETQKAEGFNVLAFCSMSDTPSVKDIDGIPIIYGEDRLLEFIELARKVGLEGNQNVSVDEVWITLPLTSKKALSRLNSILCNTAARVYYVPDLVGLGLKRYEFETMLDLPIMEWSEVQERPLGVVTKRVIDVLLASACIIILAPLMLIIAILIKVQDRGPLFFFQKRNGLDGKEFTLIKLRSMKIVTNPPGGVVQATLNDERVTAFGKILRKYSIDELPQLLNVLLGDMSIVGPRPHAIEHNEFYRNKIDGYMSRHRVKPGITGWAQVNGFRGETPKLEDMENRLRYDLEYIKNSSIAFDFKILVRTTWVTLLAKNAY
jgi:putative colanic acid biosynthesis UDP-glucose lipid carrier transferase